MLTKEEVKNRLKSNKAQLSEWGVDAVGLLGSYQREEQHENSDIDLLLSFRAADETFENLMDVCYFLEEVFDGVDVEVVTRNGLSPYIEPQILAEAEYV